MIGGLSWVYRKRSSDGRKARASATSARFDVLCPSLRRHGYCPKHSAHQKRLSAAAAKEAERQAKLAKRAARAAEGGDLAQGGENEDEEDPPVRW